jgi:Domain of unknown function (DUF4129)
MTRAFSFVFALIVLGGSPAMLGESRRAAPESASFARSAYDATSFAAELRRIAAVLEKKPSKRQIAALQDSLPSQWAVATPEGSYSISSDPLRNELASGSEDLAQVWVEHLAEEVESSTRTAPNSPLARQELTRILARREFAGVAPPGAWELFRQRVAMWLERMLGRLFGGIVRYPIGAEILFWALVLIAVGFIAMWLFRYFASSEKMHALPSKASVVSTLTWQEWVRGAREAAKRGNYREAVHCAYWAGVVRLEDTGTLPKDRTKTPREYLRLLAEPVPGQLMASPTHREPLAALTTKLEQVWYANRGAAPADFSESLRQLEALGCSLE